MASRGEQGGTHLVGGRERLELASGGLQVPVLQDTLDLAGNGIHEPQGWSIQVTVQVQDPVIAHRHGGGGASHDPALLDDLIGDDQTHPVQS